MNGSGFSDRDDPFQPGDLVEGRYRVIRRLSAGGVGAVYEAEHAFTGLHVALKALHNQRGDNPERMRAEARTLAEMRHPNIVQITDGGVAGRVVWFTMELLEGRTLREEISTSGPLGIARALMFAAQIAEGVATAHAADVIHRDLKPENIFVVAQSDTIKILDFGTSKITGKQRRSVMLKTTDRFRLIGTQAYMPPERLRAGLADARADVYAIGHILYEMLAGRHCWSEGPGPLDLPAPQELGLRQIYTPPPPIREHTPDVPEWVESVVLTALAKDPDHRQQTMGELSRELRAALDRYSREHPVEAPRMRRSKTAGDSLVTEPVLSSPSRALDTATTREQPLWALHAPLVRAAGDRARIDTLLVCGAARFATANTEPDDIERGVRLLADREQEDPGRRGMVRALAYTVHDAAEPVRESVRKLLGWVGATTGDAQEEAIAHLLRSMAKRGWRPEGDRIEPLPHAALALGGAMLMQPARRLDSAENALVRLRDHDIDVESLAVSVMVAFARTESEHHAAPRGALLALLLGGGEDSEIAHAELAQFVLSAAAVPDSEPRAQRPVRASRSEPSAQAEPRVHVPASPTPPAVSSSRRQPEPKALPRASRSTAATMTWVLVLSALASGVIILASFAVRSPRRSVAPPAPSAATRVTFATAPAPDRPPLEAQAEPASSTSAPVRSANAQVAPIPSARSPIRSQTAPPKRPLPASGL